MERFSDTAAQIGADAPYPTPLPPATEVGEGDWTGVTSAGLVLVEPDGRVWIREPRNHFGGYRCSWPKGRIGPGEHPQAAAHRETWEETGLCGCIVALLGDYAGSTFGLTRFYLADRVGGTPRVSPETSGVILATPAEAEGLLHAERDLAVLARAVRATTS